MAGINPATVNRIENGERSPTVDTLEKLAGALDLEVADFFPRPLSGSPFWGVDDPSWLLANATESGVYGGAYGDDWTEEDHAANDFVDYLYRLEGLIPAYFGTLMLYSHPEAKLDDPGQFAQRTHMDWARSRIRETCLDYVRDLDERTAKRRRSGALSREELLEEIAQEHRKVVALYEEHRSA
jgi:transcriptional regulator with XRE-family HTH domain